MKSLILLISILLTTSSSFALTLGIGAVASDKMNTSSSNNESVHDDMGEGLVLRIGGDITSSEKRAHSLELEITGLLFEEDDRKLYLNTNMLNYTYTRFFENHIFLSGGLGAGVSIANVDKDINDLGLGFTYQTIAKTGFHFWDQSILIGVAYRCLNYADLKLGNSTIVDSGDNHLIALEATFRF